MFNPTQLLPATLLNHRPDCAQRAVRWHLLALIGMGGVALGAIALAGSTSKPLLASATGVLAVVLAAFSLWQLRRLLQPAAVLERLLQCATDDAQDLCDLPETTLATEAARGWNRMVHLARRWGALTELEESVRSGVISSGGNNVGDIIHSLPDGVAVTDERGTLLEANATFAAMCGMPVRESLAGRPLSEISPTLTSELANCDVADAKRVSFEFAAGGSDTLRTLRCTRSPQLLNGRPATGHVWVLRDITQQRLADSTRDSFLAAATHELRTPLANISAYAESLATTEGELDHESQKSFYNVIQSEAMRLSQLIDDLLDISHMQAGALAIDRRETDLQRVVTEVIHKVEATMESRNIEFECDLPPKYPKLAIDKSKITAALVNLLGNAAKYTPEGGRVTFRMDVKPTAVEFSVADTGIGIAPEEVDRVFERFFRSDDERVRDIPGSGLGLAITREIVRLHGGDLTADSELNVGSVFRMTLPIEEVGGLDVPA